MRWWPRCPAYPAIAWLGYSLASSLFSCAIRLESPFAEYSLSPWWSSQEMAGWGRVGREMLLLWRFANCPGMTAGLSLPWGQGCWRAEASCVPRSLFKYNSSCCSRLTLLSLFLLYWRYHYGSCSSAALGPRWQLRSQDSLSWERRPGSCVWMAWFQSCSQPVQWSNPQALPKR